MKITIIGSGNTAFVLGRLAKLHGHSFVEVVARNEDTGRELASELGCPYKQIYKAELEPADLCLIALTDSSIQGTLANMSVYHNLLVHTAGAIKIDILAFNTNNYGVMYPLQSLKKEIHYTPHIPLLIEGSDPQTLNTIKTFAQSLSNEVLEIPYDKRLRLHLAATIVNNFVNHMYIVAEQYCKDEALDFNLLKPLIAETAERIKTYSPATVQTGPAYRHDVITLDKHLLILPNYKKLRTLYMRMTDAIMSED